MPRPIEVSWQGDDEGYVKALIAADYWNTTCQANLIVVHHGGDGIPTTQQARYCGDKATGKTYSATSITDPFGAEQPDGICVDNSPDIVPGELAIITHEFGHALGLGHVSYGIMLPGVGTAQEETPLVLLPGLISADQCNQVR